MMSVLAQQEDLNLTSTKPRDVAASHEFDADASGRSANRHHRNSLEVFMESITIEETTSAEEGEATRKTSRRESRVESLRPDVTPDGPIILQRDIEICQDMYPIPEGLELEWGVVDVTDDKQLDELQAFLRDHYVEDNNGYFRFNYTSTFLRWATAPPNQFKDWNVALRDISTKALVGFVSSVPVKLRVRTNVFSAREFNFLCVRQDMRKRRLAPLLLKESERRGHLRGFFQTVWTSGDNFPDPVSSCQYYHRLLNVPKLVELRFTHPSKSRPYEEMLEYNRVPSLLTFGDCGLRMMEEKDVASVTALYTAYMNRFDLVPQMTEQEISHFLLGGKGSVTNEDIHAETSAGSDRFVWAYVIEDPETQKITDFFSFYSIPITALLKNAPPQTLHGAYLAYYATDVALSGAANMETLLRERLISLIRDAVVLANQCGFDVFNALTMMDNLSFLKALRFGDGDGHLKYYLDNWKTAPLAGTQSVGGVPAGKGIGLVML